jgi:CRP/FNR family transcriptional regulator, anaerobic regulatory protein
MEISSLLKETFPSIYEESARNEIEKEGIIMELKAGEMLMDIGGYIKYIPLVMKGMLKIMREDSDGNELLLYYIRPGETCAMSLTCCMGDAKSTVRAEVEEDVLILAIPIRFMDQWTNQFQSWKSFVMHTYQMRYEELLKTIDGIAFQKLDDRLERALKEKCTSLGTNSLVITHQELANELNSSREVISRLLKQMERKGKVQLGRHKIEVL